MRGGPGSKSSKNVHTHVHTHREELLLTQNKVSRGGHGPECFWMERERENGGGDTEDIELPSYET